MASAEDQEMFDEIVENLQADLHIEMDRADTFEVTFDKVKRWLAAAQKQLDRPFISLNTIVMATVDTTHVAVVEGISVLTSHINSDLVPCEEHLIPVEGAGAVEVSVQTDDGAAEDPDDLPAAQTVERLMKEAADAEAERDEALEKLAAEPDHNENILAAIRAGWIIPNYFEQEHFDEMEDWDQDRLNQFQSYLERVVCGGDDKRRDDFVRQGIQKALENFIEENEPQYQEPCWNCPDGNILHINMGITCIKCISTGEEHTVCIHCWHGGFEDDDDWVDMDASSDEDPE